MNVLILGDGPEEHAWARALAEHPDHQLRAACPGLTTAPELSVGPDLDAALATAGIEAVIVGGDPEFRSEGLRRVAGLGLPAIVLHPPGPNADPYYQVALSRQETGAVVVPDLPARRHPAIEHVREALAREVEAGTFRGLSHEVPAAPSGSELVGTAFARAVDVVRSLIGEIEAVTASGDPPGERPSRSLVVHLRGPEGRLAEVRATAGPEPCATTRLVLSGGAGTLTFEHDPDGLRPSRLILRDLQGEHSVEEFAPWSPHGAILNALEAAIGGEDSHPDLLDGTRAMELTEAVLRSLRRGRTVEMNYEAISELGNFKSVMTGLGCGLLFLAILLLPLALAGPWLGVRWLVFLAWGIPPLLLLFLLLQLFRFAVRP